MQPPLFRDSLIFPLQEVLEQVPQELQRHVLKRERGSVEQLEHIKPIPNLPQRRHVRGPEGGVRPLHQIREVAARNLGRINE
ncbi:hypothetical protein BC938DRAFT_473282 [Jimgerdemannia flammicorona]|uniref:Uncharacterized protein n=1 Tax=Jimgerdemannia flammicorona TaxID=994334 RepID=A0A433Q4D2_9FUNG|nr:hypothetical protein BC938DRAFT_473282 [Jimgerdemannia flammicorona]